ncbi:MAG: carbamoyl phosphate synthase large subunit, partial [Desulfobacterium sp.]|nr:carbamoyl phosphate synthase large subunit [Desulfobacterium sp.]
MLRRYLKAAVDISIERPVLIDKFLDNAIEAEADAIADGTNAFVPAVMEHIELAGIHSGDSACVIPPVSIPPKHIDTISEYTKKIAVTLHVVGLMNIQYAIYNNTVYVLEANPRASRTVPIVSKVCNISMARLATQIILGKTLSDLNLKQSIIPHYGVKESVFPFNMFHEVDPVLGPEMRSTGEVLGLSTSFGSAFYKAQEATQITLPLEGSVLFTIADRDKASALEPVRLFRDLGFTIMATKGTGEFLKERGIETIPVSKLGLGRPDLMDAVKIGKISLLINTPSGKKSAQDSSDIRRAAIKYKVPYISTTAAAIAAAKGIAALREEEPKVCPLQEYHANIK